MSLQLLSVRPVFLLTARIRALVPGCRAPGSLLEWSWESENRVVRIFRQFMVVGLTDDWAHLLAGPWQTWFSDRQGTVTSPTGEYYFRTRVEFLWAREAGLAVVTAQQRR